jgi:hypothetical protein
MNQRRHAKAFPLAATLVILALAICFVTFAIKALMVKYQVVQGGTKIKQLERELGALALSNQSLQTAKARLISPPELKRKLDSGFFKGLLEIKENYVITVGRPGNIARTPALIVPPPPASRPPKNAVAAANVIIGREDRR